MKKAIYLLLGILVAAGCMGLIDLPFHFPLEGKYWAVIGLVAPKEYQELGRLHYDYKPDDEKEGLVPAELSFTEDEMTLVFPGGAYRKMGYKLDSVSQTISFDGVLLHGAFGAPDVTSCKYYMEVLLGGEYVTFYDAADREKANPDAGEWSLTFSSMISHNITPQLEIDCEYGTMFSGSRYGLEDGPLWNCEFADGDAPVPFYTGFDMATAYFGPAWRLPTRSEGEYVLSASVARRVKGEDDGAHSVGLLHEAEDGYWEGLVLSAPEMDVTYGFWLADGSAITYAWHEDGAEAALLTETEGKEFFVLAVRDE